MNTFRSRSVATALVLSFALLSSGCASWHEQNARHLRQAPTEAYRSPPVRFVEGTEGRWKAYQGPVEVNEVAFLSMCGQKEKADILQRDHERDGEQQLLGLALAIAGLAVSLTYGWKDEVTCYYFQGFSCSTERKPNWPVQISSCIIGGWGLETAWNAHKRLYTKQTPCDEARVLAEQYNASRDDDPDATEAE